MADLNISPELRAFYVWWLGQVRNNPNSSAVSRSGLCAAIDVYNDEVGLPEDLYRKIYKEQRNLFNRLYGSISLPFGCADWSFNNPARMAHVERFAISPELRQFYRDWLRLSATRLSRVKDADYNLHAFLRVHGICPTLSRWAFRKHGSKTAEYQAIKEEQRKLLSTLYGRHDYPFNAGMDDYMTEEGAHRNTRRRAHVKRFAMQDLIQ